MAEHGEAGAHAAVNALTVADVAVVGDAPVASRDQDVLGEVVRFTYVLRLVHARNCDLMLLLGSSLTVRPASSLVGLALRSGARIVLVNRGETPYDGVATLRLWTGIGEVIPPAVERAKQTLGE